MILLWGLPTDPPLANVASRLRELGAPFYLLDQRFVPRTTVDVSLGPPTSGRIMIDGLEIADLEAVTAVYLRPYESRRVLARTENCYAATLTHADDVDAKLLAWADVAPGRIINRPQAMISNESKPFQARLIEQVRLHTPDTLITTDVRALERFRARHDQIIYKSISSTRSIVSRLHDAPSKRLQNLRWCPTQFQEYIAGVDFRVHVLGDEVYASRICSAADDYRYAAAAGSSLEVRPTELPSHIADRCRHLASATGLAFAGIDLRFGDDNEWYCFEVNPSPGFSFYQYHTGVPIDLALAKYLVGSLDGKGPADPSRVVVASD